MREAVCEQIVQGRAHRQDHRFAEPAHDRLAAGSAQHASVGALYGRIALDRGQAPHRIADAHDVERPQPVRRHREAGADRTQLGGALAHGDRPALLMECDGRGEAAEAGSGDDGTAAGGGGFGVAMRGGHARSLAMATTCVVDYICSSKPLRP